MTEYQYYEFQAIDRPLTAQHQAHLRALSSRGQISATSFVNHYDWGDFGGNTMALMEEMFDAHLYLANWGSRLLLLRFPLDLIGAALFEEYCDGECVSLQTTATHAVLAIDRADEPPDDIDWDDGSGWLASLVPLRDGLLDGDHRGLYLAWLLALQAGFVDEDDLEPPTPPGLGALSAPQVALVEFMQIDGFLLQAAASASPDRSAPTHEQVDTPRLLQTLTQEEKDHWLARLLVGDGPHLSRQLRQTLRQRMAAHPIGGEPLDHELPRRTAGELQELATEITAHHIEEAARKRAEARKKHKETAARARNVYLAGLEGREPELLREAHDLIATCQPSKYDKAVTLLQDLHDLAALHQVSQDFNLTLSHLREQHSRKSALIRRLDHAGLVSEVTPMFD